MLESDVHFPKTGINMPSRHFTAEERLPRGWTLRIRSAVLQVISLAHFAIVMARGRAAMSKNARVRQRAELERLQQEVALLREELRIKDARMTRLAPHKRARYTPTQRMAILELRAARGWTAKQAAQAFHVTPATIASWRHRLDERGADALVQTPEPVNRFPNFVRYLVQRLKTLCPTLGKVKIAQILGRAGLHLAPTTVGRMLKEPPQRPSPETARASGSTLQAKRPNHVWHIDLTVVPTSGGFWSAWLPWALPQRWPFCWWVGVVLDHSSRRVLGMATFPQQPTSIAVCAFLGRTIQKAEATPKHLICDSGRQFRCAGFRRWARGTHIGVRFGAIGQQGSLAVLERFFLTLKNEGTRRLLIPLKREWFTKQLQHFTTWYNVHRPHMTHEGQTPDEVYYNRADEQTTALRAKDRMADNVALR